MQCDRAGCRKWRMLPKGTQVDTERQAIEMPYITICEYTKHNICIPSNIIKITHWCCTVENYGLLCLEELL